MRDRRHTNLTYFYRTIGAAALVWTLAIAGSAYWDIHHERQYTLALVKKEAIATFNKDYAFRLWATRHGGVYVPLTERTPANPYLSHIPDRDITLPSGKRLTLMNPAYMLRQLMTEYGELYGVKGRLTSLKPLNPMNEPDAWEWKALTAFARGEKEVSEITEFGGEQSLRMMQPLITQEGCLKCHAHQGYKVGDVRGGMGINVPMAPYFSLEKKTVEVLLTSHAIIWLLGSSMLVFVFIGGRRFILRQMQDDETLKESENRLSDAQRITHIGSWELDLANNALTWSDEIYRLFEIDPGKFGASYEAFLETVHPDDREAVDRAYTTSVANRTPYAIDHRLLFADGRIKHVHERCETHYDQKGRPLRSVGTVQDITESVLAAEAMKQLSRKFELILNSAGEGIYSTDRDGRIIAMNPAARKILGFAQDEPITGDSHLLFHHTKADGSSYPKEECPLYRSLATGREVSSDNEVFWTMDGRRVDVEFVAAPLFDKGRITGGVCVFRDITERKKAEAAVRESEERYRTLVDNIDLGITLIDKNHRIVAVNKAQGELFHRQVESFAGKYCFQEFEKKQAICGHCPGIKAMAEGRPAEVITEGVRDDGSRFTVKIMAFPLQAAGDLTGGFIEVVEDITEQKKMQDELELHRKHLEDEVLQRTADLTAKTEELEKMNRLFVGRELRMIELKERIHELEKTSCRHDAD